MNENKKSYLDYMLLFNQPSGRKMRKIQRKFGTVLVWEIILLAAGLLAEFVCYLISGEKVLWFKSFFNAVFVLALIRDNKVEYGMLAASERKNLFYRTLPQRDVVLKKAMISAEANRFISVLVYCVFSYAFSEQARWYDIVLNVSVTYIICVIWVNFKRMDAKPLMVLFLVFVSFLVLAVLMDELTGWTVPVWLMNTAAVLSIIAAGVTGFFLNRWSYRSICKAGRKTNTVCRQPA